MTFTIRPLTPDLSPALEDLFGKLGACLQDGRRPRPIMRHDLKVAALSTDL